jgi:hypothetical protein
MLRPKHLSGVVQLPMGRAQSLHRILKPAMLIVCNQMASLVKAAGTDSLPPSEQSMFQAEPDLAPRSHGSG